MSVLLANNKLMQSMIYMNINTTETVQNRGGSISPLPILIFLTQNIGGIDILYCSILWPTHTFLYHLQSNQ